MASFLGARVPSGARTAPALSRGRLVVVASESRIGKAPIAVPSNTTVTITPSEVSVKVRLVAIL